MCIIPRELARLAAWIMFGRGDRISAVSSNHEASENPRLMSIKTSSTNEPLPDDLRESAFIVVPAFNEAEVIADVVTTLKIEYVNVIVVDDGSRDETARAAKAAGANVLRHAINRGQGAALQTGIDYALLCGARYIVTFDADGQHDVADIARLLEPIAAGECEISLGSRFLGNAVNLPASRRVLLKLGVVFTRFTSGVSLTDVHNGLRAFSRKAAVHIQIQLDGMAHASEMIDLIRRSELAYREVPVTIRYTDYSRAKGQSSRGAIRIALHYLLGRVVR